MTVTEREELKQRMRGVISRYVRTLQDASRIPEQMLVGLVELIQQEVDDRMFRMDLVPRSELVAAQQRIQELEAQPVGQFVPVDLTEDQFEQLKRDWAQRHHAGRTPVNPTDPEPVRPQGKTQRTRPAAG